MTSKLGMAYVALGLAAEHTADNVAGPDQWRNPANRLRRRPVHLSPGTAHRNRPPRLGEEALTELAGITNFDAYWCTGEPSTHPIYIDTW